MGLVPERQCRAELDTGDPQVPPFCPRICLAQAHQAQFDAHLVETKPADGGRADNLGLALVGDPTTAKHAAELPVLGFWYASDLGPLNSQRSTDSVSIHTGSRPRQSRAGSGR